MVACLKDDWMEELFTPNCLEQFNLFRSWALLRGDRSGDQRNERPQPGGSWGHSFLCRGRVIPTRFRNSSPGQLFLHCDSKFRTFTFAHLARNETPVPA
jgi:hypothetical protein